MRSSRKQSHPATRARITVFGLILLVLGPTPPNRSSWPGLGQESSPRRIGVAPRRAANLPKGREPAAQGGLALAYALFVADSKGEPVQTPADRIFANGEKLRISIESNVDGWVYVFDQEGDDPARLVFPNLRIRRGISQINARVPLELPGAKPAGDLEWFNLSGSAPTERLIIVVSRTPVEAWPSERRLSDYPSGFKLARQEIENLSSVPLSKAKEEKSLHRDSRRSSGGEQSEQARGPKVSRKEAATTSVVVTAPPGAARVVAYVELRTRK